jgi:hypothetical protein
VRLDLTQRWSDTPRIGWIAPTRTTPKERACELPEDCTELDQRESDKRYSIAAAIGVGVSDR